MCILASAVIATNSFICIGTLFDLINEKGESDEPSLTPHLWSYRPKITVEHLTHYLDQGNYKQLYPILHEFLKQVHVRMCSLLLVVCRLKVLAAPLAAYW